MSTETKQTMEQKAHPIHSHFTLVIGTTDILTPKINDLLSKGYQLHGSPMLVGGPGLISLATFAQALVFPVPLIPLVDLLPPPLVRQLEVSTIEVGEGTKPRPLTPDQPTQEEHC